MVHHLVVRLYRSPCVIGGCSHPSTIHIRHCIRIRIQPIVCHPYLLTFLELLTLPPIQTAPAQTLPKLEPLRLLPPFPRCSLSSAIPSGLRAITSARSMIVISAT